MTTLIAVYNSDGCVGRCDAHCYNAKHPNCDCICGGRNHGAGLQRAVENTREMVDQLLETYATEHQLQDWHATVNREATEQLSLFAEMMR